MADQKKTDSIQDKIRQTLEKLGQALDEWLAQNGLKPQPVPIPVNRPDHRRS